MSKNAWGLADRVSVVSGRWAWSTFIGVSADFPRPGFAVLRWTGRGGKAFFVRFVLCAGVLVECLRAGLLVCRAVGGGLLLGVLQDGPGQGPKLGMKWRGKKKARLAVGLGLPGWLL